MGTVHDLRLRLQAGKGIVGYHFMKPAHQQHRRILELARTIPIDLLSTFVRRSRQDCARIIVEARP